MTKSSPLEAPKNIDIALLLEGTYPYVHGGVSSWVHQMIRGLPDVRFAVIFIGGKRSDYGAYRYEIPENVVHIEEHFLMDSWVTPASKRHSAHAEAFKANDELHQAFKNGSSEDIARAMPGITKLLRGDGKGGVSREDFFYSRESWQQICDYYDRYCTDPSFVDYFWTVRTMHAPLFDLIDIARRLPKVHALHAISTGYAGFLGALAHQMNGTPLLLTEHGIYTKERRIDLAQAEWIRDGRSALESTLKQDISHVRSMWIRFFEGLGRMIYGSATSITALYEGNRERQILDGAPPQKTRIIPNGIDIARYDGLRGPERGSHAPVLGLIGRIAPIKDLKTFIRSMRSICNRVPEAQGWIVGGVDGDELYLKECESLVLELGLEGKVRFLGFQNIKDILPQLDLVVLSSISEAQPLVVLEGFSAGVPAVTTDVGCCADLIHGADAEDRALGSAGEVVPISNPEKLADAALELLQDPQAWAAARLAGLARTRRYYGDKLMLQRYRGLYAEVAPIAAEAA